MIAPEVTWLFVPTMLAVSLQNITAAYLVGSGHVQQFIISLVTAIGLVALILVLHASTFGGQTLPLAILVSMAAGVIARLILATRIRQASGTA